MDFRDIRRWGILATSVDIFQFWLQSENYDGHFTSRPTFISVTSRTEFAKCLYEREM